MKKLYETHDRIAVIRMESPPVNSLAHSLRIVVFEALDAALQDGEIDAVVLCGAGQHFCGGAAIDEFNLPVRAEPSLKTIIDCMEASPKPILAAIHGSALGGGLELALGCHYRVATPGAQLGLPEITLGLLPGGGGTQRLPRLVGVEAALKMILSGERLDGASAARIGLVDDVLAGAEGAGNEVAYPAVAWLQSRLAAPLPAPLSKKTAWPDSADGGGEFFEQATEKTDKMKGNQRAARSCVACVRASTEMDFEQGLAFERSRFLELVTSSESVSLRHLFFAERKAARVPGVPADLRPEAIAEAAVVGAGLMGSGIAMCFANAGIPVRLLELNEEALNRGMQRIEKTYADSVAKGRLAQAAMDHRMGLITPTPRYEDLASVDLVVEAVFEEMQVKQQVFSQLDAVCKPEAILATNTSRLDIDEIASVTQRPGRIIGMHFFSPANVMRLLEVVRARCTSDQTLTTVMRVGRLLHKLPVSVGVCDGFVGNRMVATYFREAGFLLEEGASPSQVDKALLDFGMAMGPFAMSDMVGLDISWAGRKRMAATRPKHLRYSKVADVLCESGRLGQKTGAGYFRYEPGSRKPQPDPEVDQIIVRCAAEAGIARRMIPDQEIVERMIYALVNEGAKILEDGVASRASDIDLIYVNGYGFPASRGGPMFFAQTMGLMEVSQRIRTFHEAHGFFWELSPLLSGADTKPNAQWDDLTDTQGKTAKSESLQ